MSALGATTRWTTRLLVGALLVATLLLLLLAATEAGTRWLYARMQPYLPAALSIGDVGGTLLTGLDARDVRWRDATVDVRVEALAVDIDLTAAFDARLGIDSLAAGPVTVTIAEREPRAAGSEPFAGFRTPVGITVTAASIRRVVIVQGGRRTEIASLALAGRLLGDRLRLDEFTMQSPWLSFGVRGTAELSAPFRANLRANWQGVRAAGRTFAGELETDGRLASLTIAHRLTSPFEIRTTGSVAIADGSWRAELVNRWQEAEWDFPVGRLSTRNGELTVAGNTSGYTAAGRVTAAWDDWPEAVVDLDLDGDLAHIEARQVDLATGAGDAFLSGSLAWFPALEWNAEFRAAAVDPGIFRDGITGTVGGEGRFSGRLANGRIEDGRLVLRELDGNFMERPIAASADISFDGARIGINELDLASGPNTAAVSGTAGEALDLDVRLNAAELAALDPRAAGRLAVTAGIKGTVAAPILDADVDGNALVWEGSRAATLAAGISLDAGRTLSLEATATDLEVAGRRYERAAATIDGTLDSHRIGIDAAGAGITARASAAGAYAESAWRGRVESLTLDGDRLGRWRSAEPASLAAAPDRLELALLCLDRQDGAGRACAEVAYAPDVPLDFAVSLAELPAAALPITMPAGGRAEGRIFLEAAGEVEDSLLSGSARLEVRDARVSGTIDGEPESIAFDRIQGNADLEANRLDAEFDVVLGGQQGRARLELRVADVADAASSLAGRASVGIDDLALAALLVPAVDDLAGRIDGTLDITGTRQAPAVVGQIALRDTSFDVPAAGIEIREMEVVAAQRGPGTLSLDGSAKSGDGSLTITGRTTFGTERGLATTVDIQGDRFELIELPDLHVLASPGARVVIDEQRIRVTGALLLPLAEIKLQELPQSARRRSPDVVVHGRDAPNGDASRLTSVDLGIALGEAVSFDGFGLTTGLSGALRLQVAPGRPARGSGRISLEGGRYEAYGQDLDVERGYLIFNGPLSEPLLDIRAVRRLPEVTAGINVTGTPNRLQSDVFSEPPLTDAEALSYLLTGHGLERSDAGEGDLLNKAAFALGLSRAGSITSEVRSSLGLETLTVEGGADDARIVAGKRLGSGLLVEYGYGLVDQLGTLIIKYQINDRLLLESSTGSVSSLDLVYKVRTQ